MQFWSKIWQWLKLLNSFPFIKKTPVNQVYIRIWSFWLTFTVLHGMKRNFKISQFSRFLLRSGYAIQVKIWKWLKLLNSVPFIKKTLVNQVYIRIWSFWLTFTDLQWMKKNSKISQFSSFLLRSWFVIQVRIWKWIKVLNSVPFIKKIRVNHVYIGIWYSWLTFTALQWIKTNFKISQFEDFCWSPRMRFCQTLKTTKTSSICSIHPENNCKSSLHSNLIILTDFHSFTVNEENSKISQFSNFLLFSGYKIWVKISQWLKLLN